MKLHRHDLQFASIIAVAIIGGIVLWCYFPLMMGFFTGLIALFIFILWLTRIK